MASNMADQTSATPSIIEQIARKSKASAPPVAYVFICLAWLQFSLILVNTGLQGIIAGLETKYESATARLAAFQDCHTQQSFVNMRLESLLALPFTHGLLFETHHDCLLRAANIADFHYLGVPYHEFPDYLEQTVEWAQGNCDKLSFAPANQYHPPGLLGDAVTSFSEKMLYFYRRVKTAGMSTWDNFCKRRLVTKLHNAVIPSAKNGALQLSPKKSAVSLPKKSLVLPSHLRIDCSNSVCHLSGNASLKKVLISNDNIASAQKAVLEYKMFLDVISMAQHLVGLVDNAMFPILLAHYACLTVLLSPAIFFLTQSAHITTQKIYAHLRGLQMEGLIASPSQLSRLGLPILWLFSEVRKTKYHIPGWLIEPLLVLGFSSLIVFFLHSSSNPPANIKNMIKAIKTLQRIWSSPSYVSRSSQKITSQTLLMIEAPPEVSVTPYTTGVATNNDSTEIPPNPEDPSSTANNTLKSPRPRVWRGTTLKQDLDEMIERLHNTTAGPSFPSHNPQH